MSKSSENNRAVFNKVQKKLSKLEIKQNQNDIELILAHFDFDVNKTVEAFRNLSVNEILQDCRQSSTKNKQIHEQRRRTSAPKPSSN
ncbi:unnamed protein product [Adineta steineri]|uniref:Uncharacterized protein n=1 Tax=Adineta steineri TaxID=433720 RepID=A0A813N9N8_9BILA|nr:unnamed protein product [Adineta steineri]CAF0741750.1 unnamed protein product [Adineta steineri]CAF0751721.1 unnamed protein product [Adineta steineri]